MRIFSKESLELLRSRLDLVEVLGPYLKLQRSGASYKALCPFHDEKTPSFIVQPGDTHYHCFGCGAHGDAIQFLMNHLHLSFVESVETLAERMGVVLDEVEDHNQPKGPSKTALKETLEKACQFFQFYLLHTRAGNEALRYLYQRGIDLGWIRQFRLGFAPQKEGVFSDFMESYSFPAALLKEAGLYTASHRPFFVDRIMIPILDSLGNVIGFTARKMTSEAWGPKYINTPETPLFKKSRILFGLSFSRKRIAKERRVLVVEGQIDAMRLIYNGFDWTVAGQGTAFGEEMVRELTELGVRQAYLALDGDQAGQGAAVKIGNLFQKAGVEVWVLPLPVNRDPDLMMQEKGPEEWQRMIDSSKEYLSFLIEYHSQTIHIHTPAGKNELVQTIASQIRSWDHPLMVHESLRKLSLLTQTPEAMMGIQSQIYSAIPASIQKETFSIDPDRVIEADLLRWLLLFPPTPEMITIVEKNLSSHHFRVKTAQKLFEKALSGIREGKTLDLLSMAIDLDPIDEQPFFDEIVQKKVNRDRAIEGVIETVTRILDRDWMQRRDAIQQKMLQLEQNSPELFSLAKEFDELKRSRHIVTPNLK